MTKKEMYLLMVTTSLLRRKSRMVVALLAIIVGTAILSGLMTLYFEVPKQLNHEFRSYGANLVLLPQNSSSAINTSVIDAIKTKIPESDIVGITGYRYENIKINEQPFVLSGTDFSKAKKTSPFWLVDGAYPEKENEIVIGQNVARFLDKKLQDKITINGVDALNIAYEKEFVIVGILQTGGAEENNLYVTLPTLEGLMHNANILNIIECSLAMDKDALKIFSSELAKEFNYVVPKLVKRITKSEGSVLGKLKVLFLIVNLVVLFLTMICVVTTMVAVVTERRKEIGLKIALGATKRMIINDFLGEILLLGLVGGLVGVITGYYFAEYISIRVFNRDIDCQYIVSIVAIIISLFVTFAASIFPIKSATRVKPSIVLRGE